MSEDAPFILSFQMKRPRRRLEGLYLSVMIGGDPMGTHVATSHGCRVL
jgi:hypothetical protein